MLLISFCQSFQDDLDFASWFSYVYIKIHYSKANKQPHS